MLLHSLRLWFALCPIISFAQVTVKGRVVDEATKEPLAFVHVVPAGSQQGVTSDIDGRFVLQLPQRPTTLRFSYVGYSPMEVEVAGEGPVLVAMRQNTVQLKAVEILPTENPAHRIIDRCRQGRKVNDGMNHRSYRYTSYSKTIFTIEPDTNVVVDTTLVADTTRVAEVDSSELEMRAFLDAQYLFLMESATAKSFIPPAAEKEEVLAMRVSGLKDPSFLALAAQTKTFSIYDPQIGISEKNYLGPLAPESTRKYLFLIEDTLYSGADSVFVISYRPRRRTNFPGLKGLLYINTNGYAVQNVTAEAAQRDESVGIRFQQLHEQVNGKAWFPVQLNAFIYMYGVSLNGHTPFGVTRTYLKNIEVDADVRRKEVRGPELVVDRLSMRQDEDFWQALRTDTLDAKALRTYQFMDSIGAVADLDRKMKWLSALMTGRLPIGPVDLLLNELLHYNGYEGLRLGAGLATNDRISRHMSLGGYTAYGFKDETWKYGGFLRVRPWYGRDIALKLLYENDVVESGGVAFEGPRPLLTNESTRWIYVNRMDHNERVGGQFTFRLGSDLKLWVGAERELRVNRMGYRYAEARSDGITVLRDHFTTGGFTFGARYAFRERLARLPDQEIALGTKWPILSVSAFRSVKDLFGGDTEVWRVNLAVDKVFRLRLVGDLSVRLMGGVADPDAPYSHLFALRGTNGSAARARRELLIAADNTFQTMVANEFLADRYAALHLKHSFGTLLAKGRHFKPRPGLVYNAAVGALSRPEDHRGYAYSGLKATFLEAGVVVDGILQTLGVGLYYRHGAYALPAPKDNLVAKLTASFAF